MFDLVFAVSLLLNTLQLLRVAPPAPNPWRAHRGPPAPSDGRPAALPPTAGLAAQPRAIPGLGHVTDLSHGQQPAGGSRGAPRRRGRRGGVQWRRHGDIRDKHLIIGQLNVQSLLPKLPDIRADIDERFSFDVFILSETWLKPNTPDRLVNVAGYKIVRQDRLCRGRLASGHGGVAICVRETFETDRLPTPVTGIPNSNLEIVWAAIRVNKNRRCIVGAAYRVPKNTVQQVAADLEDLEAQLQHIIATHPGLTIIIGGDLNCCLLKTGSNTPGERLSALLTQHGLQSCNTRLPTYRPAGSLLDILATNRGDLVTRAGVTRCHYGGPHDITRLALRVTGIKRPTGTVSQRRCLARVDKTDFDQQLLNADWTPVYRSAGPELKWSAFVQTFKPLLDAVAPVRRVLVRPPGAPPASENTRHLLARRRTALSAGHRQEYKKLNRQSRAAIRADCRRHLQEQLTNRGPSSMWRVLRPTIGSNKSSSPISGITADALNDYYVSIAPDLAAAVPAPAGPVDVRLPRVCADGLRVQPISMETLWAIVQGLKPSGAECSDGLSVNMIKDFFHGLGHIVLDVVNASLETGRVPASWKHAIITPIPKGKFTASDPSRTRPISILPAITKIAERAVQLQLTEYLERHHLLSETQHGYRKRHSCETALHVVSDDVLRAMDSSEIAMVDLSKCFDMVPHDFLIDKLSVYGIDPFWLDDYLRGHTQQVQVRTYGGSVRLRTESLERLEQQAGGLQSAQRAVDNAYSFV
ncbi:putative RNA-directed DNA polymerase from transposon X-element [Amphibalanus amphitrite]|uniref:Putative RNA-directed DNA polymerase from transposon X-element n=1 Tax=Amphibalanus amphitrite TaxID=1232801 RepID=A0A6A4VHU0_AMPAM|nr:putative RNA-directed DNA polymerase from transposon X-element [Amphibalanus amphitrite]